MERFVRFAIYYLPSGPLAERGAAWLGWDVDRGGQVAQRGPDTITQSVITEVTTRPGRYGFHATLKPPFRLARGATLAELDAACADMATSLSVAEAPGLSVSHIGPFLALTADGDSAAISALADRIVRNLDHFRAPPDPAELARRRADGLTVRQEEMLMQWGYPFVFEEFLFHMTLTGPLPPPQIDDLQPKLQNHFRDVLPRPFRLDQIALLGEQEIGGFRCLHRYTLAG